MLFILNCVLITLASATANNVSSKPSDNKVSSSFIVFELKYWEKKKEMQERE